ncbi:hypothetical protein KEM55_002453, partial [Ascosphaera atra]
MSNSDNNNGGNEDYDEVTLRMLHALECMDRNEEERRRRRAEHEGTTPERHRQGEIRLLYRNVSTVNAHQLATSRSHSVRGAFAQGRACCGLRSQYSLPQLTGRYDPPLFDSDLPEGDDDSPIRLLSHLQAPELSPSRQGRVMSVHEDPFKATPSQRERTETGKHSLTKPSKKTSGTNTATKKTAAAQKKAA